jgi:hypothetical protein
VSGDAGLQLPCTPCLYRHGGAAECRICWLSPCLWLSRKQAAVDSLAVRMCWLMVGSLVCLLVLALCVVVNLRIGSGA